MLAGLARGIELAGWLGSAAVPGRIDLAGFGRLGLGVLGLRVGLRVIATVPSIASHRLVATVFTGLHRLGVRRRRAIEHAGGLGRRRFAGLATGVGEDHVRGVHQHHRRRDTAAADARLEVLGADGPQRLEALELDKLAATAARLARLGHLDHAGDLEGPLLLPHAQTQQAAHRRRVIEHQEGLGFPLDELGTLGQGRFPKFDVDGWLGHADSGRRAPEVTVATFVDLCRPASAAEATTDTCTRAARAASDRARARASRRLGPALLSPARCRPPGASARYSKIARKLSRPPQLP